MHRLIQIICLILLTNVSVVMADSLDVDLIAAAQEKIQLNAQKYPIDAARGNAQKYTQL